MSASIIRAMVTSAKMLMIATWELHVNNRLVLASYEFEGRFSYSNQVKKK